MKYKMRTCCNCYREYKAYQTQTSKGSLVYRGNCPYCGILDYARGNEQGHIEVAEFDFVLEESKEVPRRY